MNANNIRFYYEKLHNTFRLSEFDEEDGITFAASVPEQYKPALTALATELIPMYTEWQNMSHGEAKIKRQNEIKWHVIKRLEEIAKSI